MDKHARARQLNTRHRTEFPNRNERSASSRFPRASACERSSPGKMIPRNFPADHLAGWKIETNACKVVRSRCGMNTRGVAGCNTESVVVFGARVSARLTRDEMLDVRRDRQTASIILTRSLARIVVRSPRSTATSQGRSIFGRKLLASIARTRQGEKHPRTPDLGPLAERSRWREGKGESATKLRSRCSNRRPPPDRSRLDSC